MAKKFKKNFGVLIISFLILSFIYNHNFFRKLYNVFIINYESRLTKKSGYCFRESVGFLRMLKKKYKFNFNPLIVNYEDSVPSSGWSIYDNHNKTDKNHKILLNYPKNLSLYFKPLNKIFYSEDTVRHSNGISNIIFDLKDDTYYCSEVIYKGFQIVDSKQNLFIVNPMTFNEPNTNNPFVHWVSYYEELNAEIPEGELGLNPGSMSRSDKLDISHIFNKPTGME